MEQTLGTSETPPQWLTSEGISELRGKLVKFARMQVRDSQLAEDAVQEALIGALQNIDQFNRHAAFQTWVFAILKNKIVDLLRKERKFQAAEDLQEGSNLSGEDLMDVLFQENGHWQKYERPTHWQSADQEVHSEHFWRVFEACLGALPEQYARLFMMREFLELATPEICESASVTQNQLNVTLYRARLRLRECLEDNWYDA
ncbi:sigma-70 family RNA polymerase sigma factor [Celerinatantimonas sp. YJH-8]|uniref:sigma-70 family RNA polymerase sigma factor n=1 Tax=Celerinatantimonas sp. YJH-8 TaxID=3228714 RepID=UPI0038BEB880